MEHLEQNQNITVNCCRKQKEFYEIPRSERMTCIHSLEEYRLISNEEYFARFGEIEAALEEIRPHPAFQPEFVASHFGRDRGSPLGRIPRIKMPSQFHLQRLPCSAPEAVRASHAVAHWDPCAWTALVVSRLRG